MNGVFVRRKLQETYGKVLKTIPKLIKEKMNQ